MTKKVPEIRFEGFNNDWEQRKLGDIFSYKQGQQVPVENQFTNRGNNRHRFIRIVDLTTMNEEPRYIEYSGHNTVSSTDLFMIRYGQPGVIGYGYEGVIANNLFKLIPKIKINNRFFKYILNFMYPKINSLSNSTTMPAISFKSLDILEVRYPDIKEQKKISEFFKPLDSIITLHQRKLEQLQSIKDGFLQKLFPKDGEKEPEIRFLGFADDWEQRKLKELVESFEYGLNSAAIPFDGENKYLRITDIDDSSNLFKQDSLTSPDADLKISDNYLLKKGDVLFARTGASVGKTYRYQENDGKVYYAGFLIRARIKSQFDSEFIFQNTLTSSYNNFIKVTSQRSGQPGVNAKEYGEFEIYVPSLLEQQKIGAFFKSLDDTIALHQRELELLKQSKKAFLQKMFV